MATIHIFATIEQLEVALPLVSSDDHILLVQQCAYLALPNHPKSNLIDGVNSYSFLALDVASRGLSQRHDSKVISMAEFVELTARFSKSIHWG